MIELCDTFVAPEYHDKVLEFFDLSTLADRLHDEETLATEYLAKDGNWHTARFIVKKRDNNGNVTHILYATRLISDAKRREKNWISIAEEANKANLAKTEFISQIAHDILTPMNAILGFETLAEQHIMNLKL
jgi:signal transduction histidine kinase